MLRTIWIAFWKAYKEASRPDPDALPTGKPWTPVNSVLYNSPGTPDVPK
jgi:hypothetical protein